MEIIKDGASEQFTLSDYADDFKEALAKFNTMWNTKEYHHEGQEIWQWTPFGDFEMGTGDFEHEMIRPDTDYPTWGDECFDVTVSGVWMFNKSDDYDSTVDIGYVRYEEETPGFDWDSFWTWRTFKLKPHQLYAVSFTRPVKILTPLDDGNSWYTSASPKYSPWVAARGTQGENYQVRGYLQLQAENFQSIPV